MALPGLSVRALCVMLWIPLTTTFAATMRQEAHERYIKGEYRKAADANLALLADMASTEQNRRYALQMLGTIYENHLLQFDSAAYWYERFSSKYARGVQKEFYRKKLAFLRGLGNDEKKGYALIQKAMYGTRVPHEQIALLEEGLATAPKLPKRREVLLLLSHIAYEADMYAKARSTMLRLKAMDPDAISGDLRTRFMQVQAIWRRSIISRVCWGVVALLLAAVLFTAQYNKVSRRAWKLFAVLCAAWVLLSAAGVVIYISKIHSLIHNPFTVPGIFVAALILLVIAAWIFLARFSLLWRISGRAAVVALPVCAVLLTVASSFLFCYHQPKRVKILEEFGDRYMHWIQATSKGSSQYEQKE
ncbi:MAG: hypothetical protein JW913_05900 [Chitinispirillaceae bacterium]|nr:hypothetical protein [Chitinispirillaceae bacterium]